MNCVFSCLLVLLSLIHNQSFSSQSPKCENGASHQNSSSEYDVEAFKFYDKRDTPTLAQAASKIYVELKGLADAYPDHDDSKQLADLIHRLSSLDILDLATMADNQNKLALQLVNGALLNHKRAESLGGLVPQLHHARAASVQQEELQKAPTNQKKATIIDWQELHALSIEMSQSEQQKKSACATKIREAQALIKVLKKKDLYKSRCEKK